MEQTSLKYPFYCACAVVHDDDGPKALNYRVDDILVWVGCLPAFSSSLVPISSRKRRRGRHIIFVLVLLFVGEGERGPVSYVTPPVGWLVGSFVHVLNQFASLSVSPIHLLLRPHHRYHTYYTTNADPDPDDDDDADDDDEAAGGGSGGRSAGGGGQGDGGHEEPAAGGGRRLRRREAAAVPHRRRARGGAGALLAQEPLAVAVVRGARRRGGGGAGRGGGGHGQLGGVAALLGGAGDHVLGAIRPGTRLVYVSVSSVSFFFLFFSWRYLLRR